jgi:DNA-binding transcriptional regulator YiaG
MNVRELRIASGMTQKAFAEYFEMPKRTIENWEGGKNICNDYIFKLMYYKLVNEGLINLENELEK